MDKNRPKMEIKKGTVKRLFSYITGPYKFRLVIVFFCILFSAVAGVLGSLFLQILIDDNITPMIENNLTDYAPLLNSIFIMAGIYLIGIISTYTYNILMTTVAQGVLRDIRDDMFSKMEYLPIKYFDTHTHGDIMSRYTNDADTLRQMITQSIPQMVSCIMTVIAIVFSMFYLNAILAIFVLCFTSITVILTRTLAIKSAKHFVSGQKSLGKVNGYVEEMLNGQKIVKVFTYEKRSEEEFDKLNNKLMEDAYNANKFANITMPVAGNLGYLEYVLVAVVGALISSSGSTIISIGTIGLIKGIDSYNKERGVKLTTYAAKCAENEILMYFRSNKKYNNNVSLNDVIAHDKDGADITLIDVLEENKESIDETIEKKDNINFLIKYLNVLNNREFEIIKKRYGLYGEKEQTQKEIADNMHISRSYVSRIEKRALIKMLREFIKNNNY